MNWNVWGLLDPTSDMHIIFSLHYVFLPRLNRAIHSFVESWCCHRIRTAGHRTPIQLFISGQLRNYHSRHVTTEEFYDSLVRNVKVFIRCTLFLCIYCYRRTTAPMALIGMDHHPHNPLSQLKSQRLRPLYMMNLLVL